MTTDLILEIVPLAEVPQDEVLEFPDRPVVLVVDDEQVIADTLSMILSQNGYSVLTAYEGKTALKLAMTTPPDLLLTDVMMPGMTGIELAIMLVHSVPTCRVLLFSGQAATSDLLGKASELGYSFDLLTKPVHPTDLLQRIKTSIEKEKSAVVV